MHHNPTPGAPPFEVLDVVEGPAQPFLETVRAYPNQVLAAGTSPAEREQAVRQYVRDFTLDMPINQSISHVFCDF